MPSFSRSLEQSLHRALALANERHHEYATLEHLLEDNPIVYLGTQKYLYGFTAKLNGFKPLPDAMIRLQGVSKAD